MEPDTTYWALFNTHTIPSGISGTMIGMMRSNLFFKGVVMPVGLGFTPDLLNSRLLFPPLRFGVSSQLSGTGIPSALGSGSSSRQGSVVAKVECGGKGFTGPVRLTPLLRVDD